MYGWNLPANFLVLRMVSFACDEHWAGEAAKESKKSDHEVWALTGAAAGTVLAPFDHCSSERCRAGANDEPQGHRPLAEYNLIHFAAYCLYPPLYMAGPIMTFNSYAFYTKKSSGGPGVLLYAIRWLLCLAVLEGGLCFFPMFAVVSCGLFWDLSPIEMAVAAYVLLKLMWLKFLLLWRFFRLWALVDGKEPPENMTRCMSNNCSLEQFWRGWHSSFNKWLVQYMYVPMGGRNNRIISVWIIFIFVAVWHDIEPKLLAWGILNAMFYLFEVACDKELHCVSFSFFKKCRLWVRKFIIVKPCRRAACRQAFYTEYLCCRPAPTSVFS